jgi:hypothetical protein
MFISMNNMNKKTIIQACVVTLCFLGSGVVLYNGFFKQPTRPSLAIGMAPGVGAVNTGAKGVAVSSIQNIDQILPNGQKLDFSILNRPNVNYGSTLYDYDGNQYENTVSADEIGVPLDRLVISKTTEPMPEVKKTTK